MKKTWLITLICLIGAAIHVKAQNESGYVNGYYIDADGKRMNGEVAVLYYDDNLQFKPSINAEMTEVSISKIKTVVLNYPDHQDSLLVQIDSESVSNKKLYFGQIFIDGPVRLYKKFLKPQQIGNNMYSAPNPYMPGGGAPGGASPVGLFMSRAHDYEIMLAQNGSTTKFPRKAFKESFLKITEEFPGLKQQISDGTFTYKDMDTVIAIYLKLKQRKAEGKNTDYKP